MENERHNTILATAKRFRLSLLTLLLLVSAVAAWTAKFRIDQDSARLLEDLPAMRVFARELVVNDYGQFASILKPITWPEDCRWDIYVPEDGAYEVLLQIEASVNEFEKEEFKAILRPGKHQLELRLDSFKADFELFIAGESIGNIALPKQFADFVHFAPHDTREWTKVEQTTVTTDTVVLVDERLRCTRELGKEWQRTNANVLLSVQRH